MATWTTLASVSSESRDILRGFLQEVGNTGLNARGLREKIGLTDVYADTHIAWMGGASWRLIAGADVLHGTGEATGADFSYHASLDGSTVPSAVVPSTLDVVIHDRRDFAGGYVSSEWSSPARRLRIDTGIRLNVTNEEWEGGDVRQVTEPEGDGRTQTNVRPSTSVGAIWTG